MIDGLFRCRILPGFLLWVVILASSACDGLPRDSAGTLDRVRDGSLRVGVVHNPPWISVDETGETGGIEAELIAQWADGLGARVVVRRDSEADLVASLHRREIDVVAAGFEADTPYRSRIALSRPYLEIAGSDGSKQRRVLAVIPGESALLFALDRFLAAQDENDLHARVDRLGASTATP